MTIIFDIETGPRPWDEIKGFYTPPEPLPDFDPRQVKVGRLSEGKAREKIEAARAKHTETIAEYQHRVNQDRQAWLSKAALSPLTGQVLAVGYWRANRYKDELDRRWVEMHSVRAADVTTFGRSGPCCHLASEKEILCSFWDQVRRAQASAGRLVGHNIFGFDLPFLLCRSWYHRVRVPAGLLTHGRYWSDVFVDTMQVWAMGGRERISLDKLARFFGVGQKPEGITGADFAELLKSDLATAIQYLLNDLEMTFGVASAMGITG